MCTNGPQRLVHVLLPCVLSFSLQAATYTWDGSSDNWNSPHWNPGPVPFPGAGHTLVVPEGAVLVTDSSPAYFPASVVINGGTLKVTGDGRLFPGTDANTQVITVNAGGVLDLDTWFKDDSQSLGRLNPAAARIVVNGGTLRLNGVTGYGRGVTINSGGATLEATYGADWLLNQLTDDTPWVYNGNPTLTFTGAGVARFEKAISGAGSVIKRGPGKWTLARTSSYTGNTLVAEGILVLRRPSLADSSIVSVADGAILSLRHFDRDAIGALILGGVTMPPGAYNRNTHPGYLSGSGSLVVGGPGGTGTPSLGWYYGGGGDAGIQQQITDSMNGAVAQYNAYGYFHASVRAEYNSGVPTAQANLGGPITFGGSRNTRVAMHEMEHVFGVGTHWAWGANLQNGIWTGPSGSRLIQQIDGPGGVIHSDGTHFWPYGLNYDNEDSPRNQVCSVRLVEAFAKDMGLFDGSSAISEITDRSIAPGASTGPIGFTMGDPGVAVNSLVLHVASSNPELVPAEAIVLGGSGADRTINITPTAGMSGTALITLSVSGGRDADFTSFLLTVGSYFWLGGSGHWDTVSSNWTGAGWVWPATGNNNDAIFFGTAGTVSVQGMVRVDDITFATTGYRITDGTLRFDRTPALTVRDGITATIDSALEGSPGLAKEGGGTLILTGQNPYTGGIYVNGGTLLVHGDLAHTASVEARNGTVLGGSGALSAVTVRSGAELSPGPNPATLQTEGLTLEPGATLTMDLGVVGDRVAVQGRLDLNGTLSIRATEPLVNGAYTLITYTGPLTGAGLTLGSIPAGYALAIDTSLPGQIRLLVAGGSNAATIIPAGAVWKYHAAGDNLGTAWRELHYDDSNPALWPGGPAELGYGDNDESTPINISGGKPQILYFRRAFTLGADEIAGMTQAILSLVRDDGAVVYLNGVEIRRDNLPAAPAVIAYDTPALTAVAGADESTYFPSAVDPGLFQVGTNLIAAEVHQVEPASSDLSFNLKLEAVVPGHAGPSQFASVPLVSEGATWKYFDAPTDLGIVWRSAAFDDSAWSGGSSMLGFGDVDGVPPATFVANNGQWTTYFRCAFRVPETAQLQALAGRILRDDGAVVYLNGVEVWRDTNMPSGTITYTTPALVALGGAEEAAWIPVPIDPAALQAGTNILAVEVHQNALTSSDLAMNFQLTGTLLLPCDTRLSLTGTTLSWPANAGWFSVETATNLTPPVAWGPLTNGSYFSNGQWHLDLLGPTHPVRFFRLQGP